MKKISIILLMCLSLSIFADTISVGIDKDTTFLLLHPNKEDSERVVKIVNSAVQVAEVVTADKPILSGLLSSEVVSGGLVALILGIWRRIELRRLKKQGKLIK